jgi:hypothetical protein
MPRYAYEVRYGNTPTVLTNVQTFNISKGRQQVQDPFRASVATITGRVPSGLPTVEIGQRLEIWCTTPSPDIAVFRGTVSDFRINYGIVSNEDTWQIDCEDSFAAAGRALTSPSAGWAANALSDDAAIVLAFGAGINVINIYPVDGSSRLSAQSVPNTNLLDVLQQIIFTEQGRLINLGLDGSNVPGLGFVPRSAIGAYPTLGAFTDGTVATGLITAKYDQVVFTSQADSFFNEVVIEPAGLADQISGTTGRRVFTGKSYDVDTAQAQNLADFVLATLNVANAVPQVVSCTSEMQTTDLAVDAFLTAGEGTKLRLILRGVTYEVFVEGGVLTANPDETRFTLYLVSAAAQNFFILDSATFGVLDQNKLGF